MTSFEFKLFDQNSKIENTRPPPPGQYLKAEWIEKSHFSMVVQTCVLWKSKSIMGSDNTAHKLSGSFISFLIHPDGVKFNVILWVTLKDLL